MAARARRSWLLRRRLHPQPRPRNLWGHRPRRLDKLPARHSCASVNKYFFITNTAPFPAFCPLPTVIGWPTAAAMHVAMIKRPSPTWI
eukprot:COSAG04_NODE_4535_length_2028_cov_1.738725_4_plen_88_part_00